MIFGVNTNGVLMMQTLVTQVDRAWRPDTHMIPQLPPMRGSYIQKQKESDSRSYLKKGKDGAGMFMHWKDIAYLPNKTVRRSSIA
jgi:hypothetical protein